MQRRHIALQRAVGLDRDKPALCAQPFALGRDDLDMPGVDLGHHHRHIGGKAVGAVVRDHRALGPGIRFLQCPDLLLFHVHRAEDKVHLPGHRLHVRGVQHDQFLRGLGHRGGHRPAPRHRVLVALAGRAGGRRHRHEPEPGVMLEQRDKPLAYHPGGADHPDPVLLFSHASHPFLSFASRCAAGQGRARPNCAPPAQSPLENRPAMQYNV